MLVNFSMFSHLYPDSYTLFSSPYFLDQMLPGFPNKLFTMGTNSVTKKIIAVGTVYLDNSSSIVATYSFF